MTTHISWARNLPFDIYRALPRYLATAREFIDRLPEGPTRSTFEEDLANATKWVHGETEYLHTHGLYPSLESGSTDAFSAFNAACEVMTHIGVAGTTARNLGSLRHFLEIPEPSVANANQNLMPQDLLDSVRQTSANLGASTGVHGTAADGSPILTIHSLATDGATPELVQVYVQGGSTQRKALEMTPVHFSMLVRHTNALHEKVDALMLENERLRLNSSRGGSNRQG